MITPERLAWLQENKIHGEIAKAVKILNPHNSVYGVSQDEARSIINGNLWGEHGEAVTDTLESIIKARQLRERREKNKYAKTN